MEYPESQNAQDARIERLWTKLDVKQKGELDVEDLQAGLRRLDHPLKNADALLRDVLRAVDTSGDGKIQYQEFRVFVEHAEKELFALFQSIDRDQDGRLDKKELHAAFQTAGLDVAPTKLDRFFQEVDSNNDGTISFEEWRNFLLFLPADTPGLKAVLSYYSSTVKINAEGDTMLSDDTIQGLGTALPRLLASLFGSIVQIASPPKHKPPDDEDPFEAQQYQRSYPTFAEVFAAMPEDQTDKAVLLSQTAIGGLDPDTEDDRRHLRPDLEEEMDMTRRNRHISLTSILPDPGYFAAGGIAGCISRTATAPLDRLKVALIANTGSVAKDTLEAAKQGNPVSAAKSFGRPLIDAMKDLWRAGGWRSLFAGNGLNVVKVMPESAIKFGSYEGAKRTLAALEGHGDPNSINPYSRFIAGGVGGMISQLCVYPLDTLKFRMQCNVEAKGLRGNALIIATAKQMYAKGGFLSAYRGLTMGLVGMFPYSAIDLGTFEFLKASLMTYNAKVLNLHRDDPGCKPGSFATGAIGAFSGAFGASVVYPINLLRTRLQAQGTKAHPQTYTGVVDCAKTTIKNEGVKGLFKGISPNLLKVVPSVSITYVVYENSKSFMNLR